MSNPELQRLRAFLACLPSVTVVDFEENIQLPSVLATLRTWEEPQSGEIMAFAYVDDFDNLWFEMQPAEICPMSVQNEIVAWGVNCIRDRYPEVADRSLDACCEAENTYRVQMLLDHGFLPQPIRTLRYSRPLDQSIPAYGLPDGFSVRHAAGEQEAGQLAALHRSAFGTQNMTIERRLALMRSPYYVQELDLLAVAPDGQLAAFCICGFEEGNPTAGYTDPIGAAASFQGRGLGKGLMTEALRRLKTAGAQTATLGTSSENVPMQKLALALGFTCTSEKLWFSKTIT